MDYGAPFLVKWKMSRVFFPASPATAYFPNFLSLDLLFGLDTLGLELLPPDPKTFLTAELTLLLVLDDLNFSHKCRIGTSNSFDNIVQLSQKADE